MCVYPGDELSEVRRWSLYDLCSFFTPESSWDVSPCVLTGGVVTLGRMVTILQGDASGFISAREKDHPTFSFCNNKNKFNSRLQTHGSRGLFLWKVLESFNFLSCA